MWESSSEEEWPLVRQRRRRVFRVRTNIDFISIYEFNERFRMSSIKMESLLQDIGPRLRRATRRSEALTERMVLCAALHWLGNGGQYHGIGDMHGISKASVCRALHVVVEAINDLKFAEVVNWPNDIDDVILRFSRIAHMPLVIGCIDGTLIKIDAPRENEQQYVDRHGDHSINVMAVCGPDFKFYYVSARWPGSVHDARVYRNSTLHQRFEAGWRPLPDVILLADSGYPLKEWMIPPTDLNLNDPAVMRFNRAHKSTRRVVENSFGILKEKFPCLNYLRVNPVFACEIIKCCFTVCNIARTDDDAEQVLQYQGVGVEDELAREDDPNPAGQRRLQALLNFFR